MAAENIANLVPPPGKYKLTYFGVAARAFPARVALFNAGIDFEDKVVTSQEFRASKGPDGTSQSAPMGKLPTLTLPSGQVISQSIAIARFAGRFGKEPLYPADPVKALIVDEVMDTCQDMLKAPNDPDPERKKALREEYAKGQLPRYFNLIERRVEESGGPFVLGKQLSIADLTVWSTVNLFKTGNFDYIAANYPDSWKRVTGVVDGVTSHPVVVASGQASRKF